MRCLSWSRSSADKSAPNSAGSRADLSSGLISTWSRRFQASAKAAGSPSHQVATEGSFKGSPSSRSLSAGK